MTPSLEAAYETLAEWCRLRDYKGHDPFDGLNSRVFQLSPFKYSRVGRLAWLQLLKRSPFNLRSLAAVAPGHNPKGLALFALAKLSRFRALGNQEDSTEAEDLLRRLLDLRSTNVKGIAWGYNFDWQNRAFLATKGTPTIVPTAFAARAFLEAADVIGDHAYVDVANQACEFILKSLNVTEESQEELCWSYSPTDHTRVFNASLLVAETLALTAKATSNPALTALAVRGARYVVRRQNPDGSWAYGAEGFQSWADNVHTAFILTSLSRIVNACGPEVYAEFIDSIRLGAAFWVTHFFDDDGWPRYYPDNRYPADSHSAGAALVAFAELNWLDSDNLSRAARVASWTIRNLRDPSGYFYYQRRRRYTVRTAYMRWSEAWMMYGIARLLEERTVTTAVIRASGM